MEIKKEEFDYEDFLKNWERADYTRYRTEALNLLIDSSLEFIAERVEDKEAADVCYANFMDIMFSMLSDKAAILLKDLIIKRMQEEKE